MSTSLEAKYVIFKSLPPCLDRGSSQNRSNPSTTIVEMKKHMLSN